MNKLPKEALAFAKSLGIDAKGLEPEAEDMWKLLNDMYDRSPVEYESFVKSQMESKSSTNDESTQCFRPDEEFCVKSYSIDGDGIRVRDLNSIGKPVYVNICSHSALRVPVDQHMRPLSKNMMNTNGMEIPMAVGKSRNFVHSKLDSIAIDVIVNPIVIECCSPESLLLSPSFKKELIELVVESAVSESGIKLSSHREIVVNAKYCGGRGDDQNTPVLFMVEHEDGEKHDSNKSAKFGDALSSPSDLLSSLRSDAHEELDISLLPKKTEIEKSNNNIATTRHADITNIIPAFGGPVASTPAASATAPPVAVKSLISVVQLDGSIGADDLTEDLSQSTSDSNTNISSSSTANSSFKKGFLSASSTSHKPKQKDQQYKDSEPAASSALPVILKVPSLHESRDMDKMFAQLDDDWRQAGDATSFGDNDSPEVGDLLANLARVLGGGHNGLSSRVSESTPPHPHRPASNSYSPVAAPAAVEQVTRVVADASLWLADRPVTGELRRSDTGSEELIVLVNNVTAAEVAEHLSVEVSKLCVKVVSNQQQSQQQVVTVQALRGAAARHLSEVTHKAAYSKKKKMLTITVTLLQS